MMLPWHPPIIRLMIHVLREGQDLEDEEEDLGLFSAIPTDGRIFHQTTLKGKTKYSRFMKGRRRNPLDYPLDYPWRTPDPVDRIVELSYNRLPRLCN
ncbi:hypothetical protein H5410_059701 [Solanum commersonii]|uniref:Uncharacterized protein n=1 Tax=Solanum commersonii TaxID=4109 RepID=A0A9J5W3G9_SOLCO|nr:hypothetical protein H5410_059701 [Solanum commersonii]